MIIMRNTGGADAGDVVRSEVWVHVWPEWKCNMAACTLQLATLH